MEEYQEIRKGNENKPSSLLLKRALDATCQVFLSANQPHKMEATKKEAMRKAPLTMMGYLFEFLVQDWLIKPPPGGKGWGDNFQTTSRLHQQYPDLFSYLNADNGYHLPDGVVWRDGIGGKVIAGVVEVKMLGPAVAEYFLHKMESRKNRQKLVRTGGIAIPADIQTKDNELILLRQLPGYRLQPGFRGEAAFARRLGKELGGIVEDKNGKVPITLVVPKDAADNLKGLSSLFSDNPHFSLTVWGHPTEYRDIVMTVYDYWRSGGEELFRNKIEKKFPERLPKEFVC